MSINLKYIYIYINSIIIMFGLTGNKIMQKREAERKMKVHMKAMQEQKGMVFRHFSPPKETARQLVKQNVRKQIEDFHIEQANEKMMRRIYDIMKANRKKGSKPYAPGICLNAGQIPVIDCHLGNDSVRERATTTRQNAKEIVKQLKARKIVDNNLKLHRTILDVKSAYPLEKFEEDYARSRKYISSMHNTTQDTELHLLNLQEDPPDTYIQIERPFPGGLQARSVAPIRPSSSNGYRRGGRGGDFNGGQVDVSFLREMGRDRQSDRVDEDKEELPPPFQRFIKTNTGRPKSAQQLSSSGHMNTIYQLRQSTNNESPPGSASKVKSLRRSPISSPDQKKSSQYVASTLFKAEEGGGDDNPNGEDGDGDDGAGGERGRSVGFSSKPATTIPKSDRTAIKPLPVSSTTTSTPQLRSQQQPVVSSSNTPKRGDVSREQLPDDSSSTVTGPLDKTLLTMYPPRRYVMFSCQRLPRAFPEQFDTEDQRPDFTVNVVDVGLRCPPKALAPTTDPDDAPAEDGEAEVATSTGVQIEAFQTNDSSVNCAGFLSIKQIRMLAGAAGRWDLELQLRKLKTRDKSAGLYSCLAGSLDAAGKRELGLVVTGCVEVVLNSLTGKAELSVMQ